MIEKKYNRYNFTTYPPTEILDKAYYKDAFKRLSFQYRTKAQNDLIAFISLRKESPYVILPGVSHHDKGCRIINAYVRAIKSKEGFLVVDTALLSALIEEADLDIMGWTDDSEEANFLFDYYWFDVSSFELASDVYNISNDWKVEGNIVYHIIVRHQA